MPLADRHVPGILAAFDLGSRGPALGRTGRQRTARLDLAAGHRRWGAGRSSRSRTRRIRSSLEITEGAAFQEAALAAGVSTPAVRRAPHRRGDRHGRATCRCGSRNGWTCARWPSTSTPPTSDGLSRRCTGSSSRARSGTHPWYEVPVGEDRWRTIVRELRAGGAPFTDELEALVPELVALEAFLGAPPRSLRTCHRDLWADNVRRTAAGSLCVFDFDNAGLADPSQELALVLVEFSGDDATRARAIQDAYAEAGGPGRVDRPAGLRDADRPARPHRRGGLPPLAGRDHRRRARLERRVGARVPGPAVDQGRDRAPACGLSQASGHGGGRPVFPAERPPRSYCVALAAASALATSAGLIGGVPGYAVTNERVSPAASSPRSTLYAPATI